MFSAWQVIFFALQKCATRISGNCYVFTKLTDLISLFSSNNDYDDDPERRAYPLLRFQKKKVMNIKFGEVHRT